MRGETHSVLEEIYFRNMFFYKFMYRNGRDIYSLQTEFWERIKIWLFATNWPNKYNRFFNRYKSFYTNERLGFRRLQESLFLFHAVLIKAQQGVTNEGYFYVRHAKRYVLNSNVAISCRYYY